MEPKEDTELNTYYEDESFACLCILNFGQTPCRYNFNGINDDEESKEIIELTSSVIYIGQFKKMKSQLFKTMDKYYECYSSSTKHLLKCFCDMMVLMKEFENLKKSIIFIL